jgi:hypothetical protein
MMEMLEPTSIRNENVRIHTMAFFLKVRFREIEARKGLRVLFLGIFTHNGQKVVFFSALIQI